MFKIEMKTNKEQGIIEMCDLEPCQIAQIVEDPFKDVIVMRTACAHNTELMNLTESGNYWSESEDLKVKLLPKGTKITLVVT